jgi:AraC family transcriptional regulator
LTLSDYEYAPGLRVVPHRHEASYLSVVVAGGYEESLRDGLRACVAGTVTFHVAGEQHSDRFGVKGARIFTVEFEPDWLAHAAEVAPLLDAPAEFRGGVIGSLMRRICAEFERMDDLTPLAIEGLALEAVAEASRRARDSQNRGPSRWLQDAHDLLAEEFRTRLTLRDIASRAGVHPAHLVREYRRHYGTTIGEAIRTRRIAFASLRLSTSSESIAQVALACGFSNQSHFTAAFRRVTGFSPAAYRRRFSVAKNATNPLTSR